MNRTIRAVLGAILILVIAFSGISICQTLCKRCTVDVTAQRLYTLSQGSKAILARLNQPLQAKLYYAKTAALKGPDQIRYFNNYYEYVKAVLEEYVAASKGMVQLEVIDPRPFSEEEEQAIRYGLRRFMITEEESFFFGLVVQTPFGVEKVIPFFSPDRQNFIEYDISYLIDTAITKQKKRIGVLSSLPGLGETDSYMARMMQMQNQMPTWTILEQLRSVYDVQQIPTDINDINDVDILLVIHPKDLPDATLFAIDQFVLKGGKAIVCVDPHCMVDTPPRMAKQVTVYSGSSDLNKLLNVWGLDMPKDTFAGDRTLAQTATFARDQRPALIIGYLALTPPCFNHDNVITAQLNQVKVIFAGVLREITPPGAGAVSTASADANKPAAKAQVPPAITRTPLVKTTDHGNSWTITSPYDLMFPDPARLMSRFVDGNKPVMMGYLVTGRFRSAFPNGITVEVDANDTASDASAEKNDPNAPQKVKRQIKGLTEAAQDCSVVVFSDVDFISDQLAYGSAWFGAKVVVGDNSALLLNTIEDLCGSSDLIAIRSRGNFERPFVVVDKIEQKAEEETADQVAKINDEIAIYKKGLEQLVSTAKQGEEEVIGNTIVKKKRDLDLEIHKAERELRAVQLQKYKRTDALKARLRNLNMGAAPAVIMVVAVLLGIRRNFRKRHYISHASDA